MRSIAIATLLLFATPAFADVKITIENHGTTAVSGTNSFPIDDDGEPIEDNIGGLYEDIAPGARGSYELVGDCGPTRIFVRLAGHTGEDDMVIDLNTCRHRTIIVSD